MITRRDMVKALGMVASGTLVPAPVAALALRRVGDPRLRARPSTPDTNETAGTHTFAVPSSTAVVHVPTSVKRETPTGLVVFLHGARRTVDVFVERHRPGADAAGTIVLAPYASNGTWDAIRADFSTDVDILDAALAWTFRRWTIDPARIALSGFSDGGTYALAIGRANGDLFSKVVAYSPGFLIDVKPVGKPPILITHGTSDRVLPIASTSRVIVPELRSAGYAVDYREFDGDHVVPIAVANELLSSLGGGHK